MKRYDTLTLWVCTDCVLELANGESSPDRPADLPEPWALWAGPVVVHDMTPGMVDEEHECGTPYDAPGGRECGCEERDFSTRACDGCGDHLHGTRHAVTRMTRKA